MKIVVNKCFGGFSLSDAAVKALHLNSPYDDIERTDDKLVHLVETDADAASGYCAKLRVVELPDNTTDWELDEYDGAESIIYVVKGKIYHA
jgi:hypothetical protein